MMFTIVSDLEDLQPREDTKAIVMYTIVSGLEDLQPENQAPWDPTPGHQEDKLM